MEIRYRCTLEDYLEAQSYQSKSVAYYLCGIFKVLTAGFSQAFAMFLLAGLWLVWPLVIRPIAIRRSFHQVPNFVLETAMVAVEQGLQTGSAAGRSETPWTAYTKFRETSNLFLIYTGSGTFEVVLKRALSDSELSQFRELLMRHVHRATTPPAAHL
jgi:hypothetical protein